jgi:Flp pilus assembly protein TadG
MKRRLRKGHDDTGSELIELAIVLPLLLLIFAAIIDFGFLFQRYEALTNAAREGARLGTLPGYAVTDVQARVQSYLDSAGLTATITPATVTYTNQELTPGGKVIRVVTVTVEYPSEFLNLGPFAAMVGGTFQSGITLRASSSMRVEAPAGGGS